MVQVPGQNVTRLFEIQCEAAAHTNILLPVDGITGVASHIQTPEIGRVVDSETMILA